MDRSHYYVMFDGGAWTIQCDGENSEPYSQRRDAFKAAVALAHLDGTNGREAAVIVQGEGGVFRPAWETRKDIYPPPLVPEL